MTDYTVDFTTSAVVETIGSPGEMLGDLITISLPEPSHEEMLGLILFTPREPMMDDNTWPRKEYLKLSRQQPPAVTQLESWLAMHRRVAPATLSIEDSMEFWRKDFARLQKNPRINLMRVGRNNIAIKTNRVEVELECKGVTHSVFLATWALVVGLYDTSNRTLGVRFSLMRLETGNTKNGTAKYEISNGIGFCFGANIGHINELLNNANLANGIELILDWLGHVNSEHIGEVIKDFTVLNRVVTNGEAAQEAEVADTHYIEGPPECGF